MINIFLVSKIWRENSEKHLPAVRNSCQGSEEVEERLGWPLSFLLVSE